jgi:hypothetical protein
MSSPGTSAAAGGDLLLRQLQNNLNLPPSLSPTQAQKLAALLKGNSSNGR